MNRFVKGSTALLGLAVLTAASSLAMADSKVAIFSSGGGSNNMTNFVAGGSIPGVTGVFVTDADIAGGILTSGGFTNILVSRNGASFGGGFSAAAAAAVKAWVNPDNVTLFLFDMADSFGLDNPESPNANPAAVTLLKNAINFQSVAPRGYIGEFNGAATALTTGISQFGPNYLGLVAGNVDGFPGIGGVPPFTITQPGNPITAGLPDGFNVSDNSPFPILSTGVPSANVFATWTDANGRVIPVIESSIPRRLFVPEPGSIALFVSLGFSGLLVARRRRK